MHPIQEQLLKLSKTKNLAKVSLRGMATLIGIPKESPQKIKHHLQQLQKKGFLTIDRARGVMERAMTTSVWTKGVLDKAKQLFSVPIVGLVQYNPKTIFSEENIEGFLRISSRVVQRTNPKNLFAVRVNDSSLSHTLVCGRRIEEGDYVIVDKNKKSAKANDVVLALIDNYAALKRYLNDTVNNQIVLMGDSKTDREPIYLHPDDNIHIGGKVIAVLKKPA